VRLTCVLVCQQLFLFFLWFPSESTIAEKINIKETRTQEKKSWLCEWFNKFQRCLQVVGFAAWHPGKPELISIAYQVNEYS
jgi:hypothetical protein